MINITSVNPSIITYTGSENIFNQTAYANFSYDPAGAIISTELHDNASDGTIDTFLDGILDYGLVTNGSAGTETFSFVLPQSFFLAHTDAQHGKNFEIDYTLTIYEYGGSAPNLTLLDTKEFLLDVKLVTNPSPITIASLQGDYFGITRMVLSVDQATTELNAINAGTTTESAYVQSLLNQMSATALPAVAVEASMYGATGTSAEITSLVSNFLPPQIANAQANGYNPQVYASEALGVVFAFGNETGNTTFATNFGPANSSMTNSAPGDAAFAVAAVNSIFGSSATTNLDNVMQQFVSNWKAFFTANGVAGIASATADQIDLAARGASWGDMVGIGLANNLGPLAGQVTNFLDDAAQGTAVYGASLVGQPAHAAFA